VHWVDELELDSADYGTHCDAQAKATLIYRRTKNLRALQLLLGYSKLESTMRAGPLRPCWQPKDID